MGYGVEIHVSTIYNRMYILHVTMLSFQCLHDLDKRQMKEEQRYEMKIWSFSSRGSWYPRNCGLLNRCPGAEDKPEGSCSVALALLSPFLFNFISECGTDFVKKFFSFSFWCATERMQTYIHSLIMWSHHPPCPHRICIRKSRPQGTVYCVWALESGCLGLIISIITH